MNKILIRKKVPTITISKVGGEDAIKWLVFKNKDISNFLSIVSSLRNIFDNGYLKNIGKKKIVSEQDLSITLTQILQIEAREGITNAQVLAILFGEETLLDYSEILQAEEKGFEETILLEYDMKLFKTIENIKSYYNKYFADSQCTIVELYQAYISFVISRIYQILSMRNNFHKAVKDYLTKGRLCYNVSSKMDTVLFPTDVKYNVFGNITRKYDNIEKFKLEISEMDNIIEQSMFYQIKDMADVRYPNLEVRFPGGSFNVYSSTIASYNIAQLEKDDELINFKQFFVDGERKINFERFVEDFALRNLENRIVYHGHFVVKDGSLKEANSLYYRVTKNNIELDAIQDDARHYTNIVESGINVGALSFISHIIIERTSQTHLYAMINGQKCELNLLSYNDHGKMTNMLIVKNADIINTHVNSYIASYIDFKIPDTKIIKLENINYNSYFKINSIPKSFSILSSYSDDIKSSIIRFVNGADNWRAWIMSDACETAYDSVRNLDNTLVLWLIINNIMNVKLDNVISVARSIDSRCSMEFIYELRLLYACKKTIDQGLKESHVMDVVNENFDHLMRLSRGLNSK